MIIYLILEIFSTNREKKQYWKLLQAELLCVNEKIIYNNAKKLYRFVTNYPKSPLAQRCCNFSLLEEKCNEYIKNKRGVNNFGKQFGDTF